MSKVLGGFVIRGHTKKKIHSEYFDALLKTARARNVRRAKGRTTVRLAVVEQGLYSISLAELVGRRRARKTT